MNKVVIEVDLDEFDRLDYVGKADWLIAKVRIARKEPQERMELK